MGSAGVCVWGGEFMLLACIRLMPLHQGISKGKGAEGRVVKVQQIRILESGAHLAATPPLFNFIFGGCISNYLYVPDSK